uniref:Macrophage mannose receptor 1 n=1 Tax=Aceria tosichella TaxID=561515 RepID=A0A6G1SMW1_9ACAR
MLYRLALLGLISFCLVSFDVSHILAGPVEEKYTCPHGWTRYGNKKCLKYVNELQDYDRAQATCRSKNQGTLVTIHSHEEQNFVYSYIHSIAASSTPIWLGAKQIDFESILWLDKTETSYTNWAPSEPSHPDEICIAINPRNGLWHDVMCSEANVPACERAPTTQWPFFVAFCSEGWFQFNDEKCVRIISSQALNFYESQELCRSKYNSKLLSVRTEKESEFVHNLIKFRDVKLPVWLGAVQNDFSSFNWIDKSDVTFTNWAESEPNDPDHACISMFASGGKWSDNDCKEQKLILCQKVPEDGGSCETGWLQFRQDKCYRFVHIRLAFDDAESLCNNLYGGHLPSIHSQEEQFMISQFLASVNVKNGSEIWLGGRQMDFHNFNWGDGSLFNYSYWEQGEPSFPAEKCIEMSWRNGRWNDINCRLKRAVLCERQLSSRHLMKQNQPANPNNLYHNQPAACLGESNCTGISSTSMMSTNGEPAVVSSLSPGSGFSTQQLNGSNSDLSFSQGASSMFDQQSEQANRTGGGVMNSTASSPDGVNFMLQPDDKPIKVIASIMNHDKNSPLDVPPELAAPAAAIVVDQLTNNNVTTQATTNSTMWSPTSSSNSNNNNNNKSNTTTSPAESAPKQQQQQNGTAFIQQGSPFEVDQQHQVPSGPSESSLSPKSDSSNAERTQQTVEQSTLASTNTKENVTIDKGPLVTTLSALV